MSIVKKRFLFASVIFLISACYAQASDLPEHYQGYLVATDQYLEEQNKHKITFIYYTLLNTNEYHSHNLGGIDTNKVYIHKDGHKEAVYDANGNLVEDCLNQGSYNYHSVSESPLMHFSVDTLPWIYWGNCEDDPSTKSERVTAFSKDFLDGSFRVIKNREKTTLITPDSFVKKPQHYAFNLFLEVLSSNELKSYKFDGTDPWMTSQKEYDLLYKDLKAGIEKVLNK